MKQLLSASCLFTIQNIKKRYHISSFVLFFYRLFILIIKIAGRGFNMRMDTDDNENQEEEENGSNNASSLVEKNSAARAGKCSAGS